MFADSPNVGILAAAGSRKTQQIIDAALESDGRVLVTTYTNENLNQIRRRIEQERGTVPANIHLATWFSFLIAHGAKPYQASVLGRTHLLRGLNFDGDHPGYPNRQQAVRYYTDALGNVYRKHLADFAVSSASSCSGPWTDWNRRDAASPCSSMAARHSWVTVAAAVPAAGSPPASLRAQAVATIAATRGMATTAPSRPAGSGTGDLLPAGAAVVAAVQHAWLLGDHPQRVVADGHRQRLPLEVLGRRGVDPGATEIG